MFSIVSNGNEAIELLNHSPLLPDLIFSDLNMPLMDGIEFLAQVKSSAMTSGIPVIMLSSDDALSGMAMKFGAIAYIKKQDTIPLLLKKMECIINADSFKPETVLSGKFTPLLSAA